MKKNGIFKKIWAAVLSVALLAACPLPAHGKEDTFRLELEAPATAAPGDIIDVVITIKDIKKELVSLEFNLDFDETKVSGLITEPGKDMDVLMTVVPTYTMEVAGTQLELSRYEQICGYNGAQGVYLCRFMDLLYYPGAKPGVKYQGLINDGDMVITIPFRVLDTVKDGDALLFEVQKDSVRGTTKAELTAVSGIADTAKTTVSDPRGLTVSGRISYGKLNGQTTVELWRKGADGAAYSATVQGEQYSIGNVADGYYTLLASRTGHVSRKYSLIAEGKAVTCDITLHLLGDVTGDGQVNTKDANRAYGHLRNTQRITDEYVRECADVTGDGMTIADVAAIYAHSKGKISLF